MEIKAVAVTEEEYSEYLELKERATPKKVEKATRKDYMESGYTHCCPSCGNMVGTITKELRIDYDGYCCSCGQALDWSDEECQFY